MLYPRVSVRPAGRASTGDQSFATTSGGKYSHQWPSQGAAGEEISWSGKRPRYTPKNCLWLFRVFCFHMSNMCMCHVQQPPTSSSTATRSRVTWLRRCDSSGDKTKLWRNSSAWHPEVSLFLCLVKNHMIFSKKKRRGEKRMLISFFVLVDADL